LENGGIGCLLSEIGIINRVSGLRTGHSSSIGSVLFNSIDEGNKVSFGFRHFLVLDLDKTIAEKCSGPFILFIFPDCGMVEKRHCEVVFD
jgi:hypothetical protein